MTFERVQSQSRAHKPSRRSPRRAFNRAIGLLRDGDYELAQAVQLSELGLSFVIASRFEINDACVVTLMIPGSGPLVLRASVTSESGKVGKMFSYGLEFGALDLHQRRMIRSYVSAKTEAEAELEDS